MKAPELRQRTLEDVQNDLTIAEVNLRNIRFQIVTQQLENTCQLAIAKREVARIKTILREHDLGIHPLGVPVKATEAEGENA
jgi:large subunit ribosomal protein L29